jgi:hypothetical protein
MKFAWDIPDPEHSWDEERFVTMGVSLRGQRAPGDIP